MPIKQGQWDCGDGQHPLWAPPRPPCLCVRMSQAGTWGPLLQCLHLDTPLLQQQNTKRLKETKNNCVHAQVGQIMDKR